MQALRERHRGGSVAARTMPAHDLRANFRREENRYTYEIRHRRRAFHNNATIEERLRALADARRNKSKECKTGAGEMFVQAIIGQRVSVPGEPDVIKFSVVSFTLPDLVGKNEEIIKATIKQNPLLASILGDVASFDKDNSLLGCFGKSSENVNDRHLKIFLNLYNATAEVFNKTRSEISNDDIAEFELENHKRKAREKAVIDDAKLIFSNPAHSGAIAYGHKEEFGVKFRMEWIYKDGQVFTIGPPSEGYPMMKFDDSIATDAGDKKFINELLKFIKDAYEGGAKSIFGIQVNNTATVGRCGGALEAEELQKYFERNLRFDTDSNKQAQANNQDGIVLSISANNGTTSVGEGAGESGNSEGVHNCKGCGKTLDSGQKVCSCKKR